MRVHLKALGCRLNEAELETWSRDFRQRGHLLTNDPDEADLVVVNTCAVTQEAVRKSRKLVRKVHRSNPQAKLVISGCYASLDPTGSTQSLGVDLVIDNRSKDRLVEIASETLELPVMPELATEPGGNLLLARGRQRAFVKVQDGCRYRCTFCIVTVARGEERSRPVDEIIDEINQLHDDGIQEIVLTGVHIGGYGSDTGSDLSALIKTVLYNTRIPRVRLGSVEPWDLPESFWELFDNPRFMPHLHVPLQSGANSVLRRMARRCRTEEFSSLIEQGRRRVPDLNITTDIIVGFPGETEEEWRESLDYVADTGFGHLHIFAYSPRSGTKAAMLPNQVERETKKTRSQELHELGNRLKKDTFKRFIGRHFTMLVEGRAETSDDTDPHWLGYTPNFIPVIIQANSGDNLENRLVEIELTGVDESGERMSAVPLKDNVRI